MASTTDYRKLLHPQQGRLPGRLPRDRPAALPAHALHASKGDALETLARDLPERIDLVLLDGAKGLYPAVLTLLEERLAPGALLVADDADARPQYLERVRSGHGYLSVPFADDIELSLRTS
jgi:predicted O-methyltransferase YrrM